MVYFPACVKYCFHLLVCLANQANCLPIAVICPLGRGRFVICSCVLLAFARLGCSAVPGMQDSSRARVCIGDVGDNLLPMLVRLAGGPMPKPIESALRGLESRAAPIELSRALAPPPGGPSLRRSCRVSFFRARPLAPLAPGARVVGCNGSWLLESCAWAGIFRSSGRATIKFGPNSATADPNLTNFDQHWPGDGQIWPKFDQIWPNLDQAGRNMISERLLSNLV